MYSGRASGKDKPNKVLAKRDASYHVNKDGFGDAILDEVSHNKNAIRGREQELIELHGGAQSQGGTSGNKINGISKRNKNRKKYLNACKRVFGTLNKS